MANGASHRYTLSCDSRRHRVALKASRYWSRTRCPVCMQIVDATRVRRARKWLAGLAPRSTITIANRVTLVPIDAALLVWGTIVILVTLLLQTVSDAWWPATILLFLGRWPWMLPALPLLGIAVLLRRRTSMLAASALTLVGLFGIMQFNTGAARLVRASYPESRVRVITFNIAGDAPAGIQLLQLVTDWEPDVLAVQECGEHSRQQLASIPGYTSSVGNTCLITKFKILSVDSLRRDAFQNAGGAAWVKRYRLQGRPGAFDFTNLHLDTPRKAFDRLIDGDEHAALAIDDKTAIRDVESRLARRWVDLGRGPRIVAGDFNMPVESAIFREHWSSMQDGWEQAGFGFGYTRLAGWIRLRIDHVLADARWNVHLARVLPDYGSDHLPVMVELDLRPSP